MPIEGRYRFKKWGSWRLSLLSTATLLVMSIYKMIIVTQIVLFFILKNATTNFGEKTIAYALPYTYIPGQGEEGSE